MRRKDLEITDRAAIDAVIDAAPVCHLAMCSEGVPYVVPMCFGYDGTSLSFHSAPRGRKIEMLKKNPRVCFEITIVEGLKPAAKACDWGMNYRSVIGSGHAVFVEEEGEKRAALDQLMRHYAKGPFPQDYHGLAHLAVIRVEIDEIAGKHSE